MNKDACKGKVPSVKLDTSSMALQWRNFLKPGVSEEQSSERLRWLHILTDAGEASEASAFRREGAAFGVSTFVLPFCAAIGDIVFQCATPSG